MTIRGSEQGALESGCRYKAVQRLSSTRYLVAAACEGEGSSWNTKADYRLTRGRLVINTLWHDEPKNEENGTAPEPGDLTVDVPAHASVEAQ